MLACAAGGSNVAVAARLGVDYKTVSRWRSRFLLKRLDGLTDDLRPGVPRIITDAQVRDRLRQRVRCFTGCYPAVSVARSKRWL